MILDRLDQADRYATLHPCFAQAFAFLRQAGLATQPCGRRELDGSRVFVMIAKDQGRPRAEAKLEAHRKYIDIQYIIGGAEEMGWSARSVCRTPSGAYSEPNDIEFFEDAPDAWFPVVPGAFVIYFPEDAHAPLVGPGEIHKVVVKIAVE